MHSAREVRHITPLRCSTVDALARSKSGTGVLTARAGSSALEGLIKGCANKRKPPDSKSYAQGSGL
jgi:hypothetical protein